MPCSVSGQSKPAPGPPQPWTKLPLSSNSRTGGAALPFWSSRIVLGRCSTQAWPLSSIDTLDTWPHSHRLGSFAQFASGRNFGTSRSCVRNGCAGEDDTQPNWWIATMAATDAATTDDANAFMEDLGLLCSWVELLRDPTSWMFVRCWVSQ